MATTFQSTYMLTASLLMATMARMSGIFYSTCLLTASLLIATSDFPSTHTTERERERGRDRASERARGREGERERGRERERERQTDRERERETERQREREALYVPVDSFLVDGDDDVAEDRLGALQSREQL